MRILLALLGLAAVGLLGWSYRLSRRLHQSERDRRRAADELNRRLSELFSLQELSFILSGSLQLDRIVEQVVRYAMRFLDAQGALVALALDGEAAAGAGAGREDRPLLRVTAADGTLAALAGRSIGADDTGLVVRSLGRERLELVRNSGGEPTRLVEGVQAESAAAVPLRAHGVVVGTLVIANPRGGAFAAEDIRLLSTVATHAAGGRRAGRVGGRGPVARARRGGGQAGDCEPARRRVRGRRHPPALHGGHARGHRDRQCPLLRDGAAREGAVGDRSEE